MLFNPLDITTVLHDMLELVCIDYIIQVALLELMQRFFSRQVASFVIWIHERPSLRCRIYWGFQLWSCFHSQPIYHLNGIVFPDCRLLNDV